MSSNLGSGLAKSQSTIAKSHLNLHGYVEGIPISLIDPEGLKGTTSCSGYTESCKINKGVYACTIAPTVCPIFPPGPEDGWFQCVRQCLQDELNHRTDNPNLCPIFYNPVTDHSTCFTVCAINSKNPGQ